MSRHHESSVTSAIVFLIRTETVVNSSIAVLFSQMLHQTTFYRLIPSRYYLQAIGPDFFMDFCVLSFIALINYTIYMGLLVASGCCCFRLLSACCCLLTLLLLLLLLLLSLVSACCCLLLAIAAVCQCVSIVVLETACWQCCCCCSNVPLLLIIDTNCSLFVSVYSLC